MQTTLSLQSWLDHLRLLNPVTGVAHVGAGTGQDAVRYAHWNVPVAVLIEAEESCHDKLPAVASGLPGWSVHTALLSDQEEEKAFYLASNPNENGILSPECLTGLWRNLKTKEQRRLKATTLDNLLAELNPYPETINWVVIDCLPALPIVRGAGRLLDGWDVIIARVVLDETQLQATGAAKAEVDVFLSGHGYRCIACEEERQPAVGRALYVRDWKTSLHARLHELQRDVAIQAEARSAAEKLAAEHQKQAGTLKADVAKSQASGEAEKATWVKEKNELAQARDKAGKLASDRQTQILALEQRLQLMQANCAEADTRHELLQSELTKAHAQIELIKELMLQEPRV